jgi:uncharacterized protein (TIGR00369 family)
MTNLDNTVFKALGIEIVKRDIDETIVRLNVDGRHLQPRGIVHGGVYVVLAESAASIAASCSLSDLEHSVVGLEINATHVRSTKSGTICARSKLLHHGRTIMLYDVRVENEEKKLVSMARCTIMIKKP